MNRGETEGSRCSYSAGSGFESLMAHRPRRPDAHPVSGLRHRPWSWLWSSAFLSGRPRRHGGPGGSGSGPDAVGHMGHRTGSARLDLLERQRRNTLEEARPGSEGEGNDVQPQLVDETGSEVLVDGLGAAQDRDVSVA